LIATNLLVRSLGGEIHPLSTGFFRQRLVALGLLGRHLIWEDDHALDVHAELDAAARRHGISPRLVRAVADVESALVHTRVSGTGAMGLMQLMPDTAYALGVRDPFDITQNADGGARYLKQLLGWYRGNLRRAVAAYNAGPGRVPVAGALPVLPDETRTYVTRVLARM
jgi:soluble lytic murein transglycosylase-like protein